MQTALSFGLPVDQLIVGIGAALHYTNEQDPQAVELQAKIAEKGVIEAFKEISGVEDPKVLEEVLAAYNQLA